MKKLTLKKETLRRLSDDKLMRVAGGANCCAYGGTAIRSASAVIVDPGPVEPSPIDPSPGPGLGDGVIGN